MGKNIRFLVAASLTVTMVSVLYCNLILRNIHQKVERNSKFREKRQADQDLAERVKTLEDLVLGGDTGGLIGATGATGKRGRDVGSNSNIVKYMRQRVEEVENTVIEEREQIQQEKKKIEDEIQMLDNKVAGNKDLLGLYINLFHMLLFKQKRAYYWPPFWIIGMGSNTAFTLQTEHPTEAGIGQNVPVLQLPSDTIMCTCDTVAKCPIPCVCYGSFKMYKSSASEFGTMGMCR